MGARERGKLRAQPLGSRAKRLEALVAVSTIGELASDQLPAASGLDEGFDRDPVAVSDEAVSYGEGVRSLHRSGLSGFRRVGAVPW